MFMQTFLLLIVYYTFIDKCGIELRLGQPTPHYPNMLIGFISPMFAFWILCTYNDLDV